MEESQSRAKAARYTRAQLQRGRADGAYIRDMRNIAKPQCNQQRTQFFANLRRANAKFKQAAAAFRRGQVAKGRRLHQQGVNIALSRPQSASGPWAVCLKREFGQPADAELGIPG